MRRLTEGLLARSDNPKAEMPFLDHLEELRWRILWSVLALVLCSIAGLLMVIYLDVAELLIRPALQVYGEDFKLIYLAPQATFFLLLQLSLAAGLVMASPVVVYQAWCFFAPAMEDHERRAIFPALLMGLFLFVAGVAMAYFIALPLGLRFFSGILTDIMTAEITATHYFGFVVQLLLAFGILFELPVVVLVLSVLGVITPDFLRSKRRHAIVVILVLASIVSPGDMITVTIVMSVPLLALYEFSIFLSVLVWRKREPDEPQAATSPPAPSPPDDAAPYGHGDPAGGSAPAAPAGPDGDEG